MLSLKRGLWQCFQFLFPLAQNASCWAAGRKENGDPCGLSMLGTDRPRRLRELGKVGNLEEGFACAGAESGWCSMCMRSPVFVELVVRGLALRQSKGQGKSGERCPGVISVSCTLLFNDPIAEGNLGGPDIQRGDISRRQRSEAERQTEIVCFQLSLPCTVFVLAKLVLLYCLCSIFSSLFSFSPTPAVLCSPPRRARAVQLQLSPANRNR